MPQKIRSAVAHALETAGLQTNPSDIPLEYPPQFENGDYATGAAFRFAKQAGLSPRVLGENITARIGSIEGTSKIEVAGSGFINFYLDKAIFTEAIEEARSVDRWGENDSQKGKRVMVEYTQPNPFKPFHIGHLMSNAIGESLSRLIEVSGAEVQRANYQGDIGLHVAKAIWGVKDLGVDPRDALALGRAYAHGAERYENDPSAKTEIDTINKAVYERSDEEINTLYDVGRAASLQHFEEIYAILGTKFDHYFFESETANRGKKIIEEHPDIFPLSDGARVFQGEAVGLHTRVFLTSEGLPTYEAKELGLACIKADLYPHADRFVVTTAVEQKEYFNVIRAALSMLDASLAEKLLHVSHGMMRFAEGKMSSRKGNVVTGEALLIELTERARERAQKSRADDPEKLAQEIAVAAIKYQILKQAAGRDIIFDRERALSLDGDSGPYLQYAHARAQQVVERAKAENVEALVDPAAEPMDLTRMLYRFPEAVEYAAEHLEPHLLVNYLISLASLFNSWYAQVHILDGTKEAAHKVALVDAVRATLKKGLWILGIPAPEKM